MWIESNVRKQYFDIGRSKKQMRKCLMGFLGNERVINYQWFFSQHPENQVIN